jgi:hypothetical protein
MKNEELREMYKKAFGKYPAPNAKPENIIKKLKQEGISIPEEEPATPAEQGSEQLKPEGSSAAAPEPSAKAEEEVVIEEGPAPAVTKEEAAPLRTAAAPSAVETHNGQPVSKGQGSTKLFLVYFRGKALYWTHNSIQAMRSFADQVRLPENTDYHDVASLGKCKNC